MRASAGLETVQIEVLDCTPQVDLLPPPASRGEGRGGGLARGLLATVLSAVLLASCAKKEPAPTAPSAAASGSSSDAGYMGREIAEPMSYLGAEWLERKEREEEEQPEHMLDILEIREGETVADVGAGSGFHVERLSKRVGPKGRVLGTDVQPEMIAMIDARVREKGLGNVTTILATPTDAKLPAGEVDLVLMVDVYHELAEPLATLAQVKRALRMPGGRLALVEFRAEDPEVPIKAEHKMTLAQIEKELAAASFKIDRVDASLPWQRVVIAVPL